jgi:hypothetical protein
MLTNSTFLEYSYIELKIADLSFPLAAFQWKQELLRSNRKTASAAIQHLNMFTGPFQKLAGNYNFLLSPASHALT